MELHQIRALFPSIAAQLRENLNTLRLASLQAIPVQAREENPELDRVAAVLDQSFYRILRLVNLLTAASVPPDAPPALENRDLVDLVGDVCDRAGDLGEALGLEVRFSCPMPRHICAVDPRQIEQLVYHLLSNAFKFTPAGGTVTVALWTKRDRVYLSVTDSGAGIPQEHMTTLFDRYSDPERQDPPPHGLGLGLTLCRQIAERHGGVIMAESAVGRGSCFTVSLPDRQIPGTVSDVRFDYTGGFNSTLLALADALPVEAFRVRSQD